MREPSLRRIEALFQAAADLPAAERGAFLAKECAGEPAARARVEALLAELESGASLGPAALGAEDAAELAEGPNSRIGRYKLLQKIGEGGFGVVYMAEQEEPVVRRVALKIIKLGMDTREVVARFEAERQALALMDHPNIARVLDGGATDSGRPYFVMELVRGVSITEYCDAQSLSTRERLELFIPVCHAVQHAHQKGVIHRDIKPSNVMVTLHDGKPVPKVIDFGVAKAMHGRLTEKTLFTAYQRFIGTPAYMSPEQAELSGLDVDTRTDIYALGVLLYELLTGSTPFDTRDLFEEGLAAVQRTIRERVPERPSVRVSTSADVMIAQRRRSDVPALSRLMKGDLDWIVLKCLEKERGRRYDTAQALAAEIERHLKDEPVLAGPPSAAYRLRKFLTRNRAAVASGAVVLLGLLIAVVGTSLGMLTAGRQRDDAVAAKRATEEEAQRTAAVTDFLVATLALADPGVARDANLSVASLLDRAAGQIAGSLGDQPAAEARVRATIGRAYRALGQSAAAELHLRRAIELGQGVPDFDRAELYDAMWSLTHTLFDLERPDAMAVAQAARRVAHDFVRTTHPEIADVLDRYIEAVNAASFSADQDAIERLPALFQETIRVTDERLPPGDALWPLVADTWMAAGYSLWYGPNEALAEGYWERAWEIQRRELGEDDPQIGETLGLLVGVLNRAGRGGEAESALREAVARMRGVLPPESPRLAFAESMLGANLAGQGRFEEAEPLLLESHAIIVATIGDLTNFMVADSYGRVLSLYAAWERPERAEPYRAELARLCADAEMLMPWPIVRLAFPPQDARLVALLERLDALGGTSFDPQPARTQAPEVGALLAELLPLRARLHPDGDPLATVVGRQLLGWSPRIAAPSAERERRAMVEEGLALLQGRDDVPYEIALGHAEPAELFAAAEPERAREHAHQAWNLVHALGSDDVWIWANTRIRLARILVRVGLLREAEELLVPSHATLVEQFGALNPDAETARALLAEVYEDLGLPERAAAYAAPGRSADRREDDR